MFVQIYIEFSEFYARRKKKVFFKGRKEIMCKTKSSISFNAKLSSNFAN